VTSTTRVFRALPHGSRTMRWTFQWA
jgi:hypothetical protein